MEAATGGRGQAEEERPVFNDELETTAEEVPAGTEVDLGFAMIAATLGVGDGDGFAVEGGVGPENFQQDRLGARRVNPRGDDGAEFGFCLGGVDGGRADVLVTPTKGLGERTTGDDPGRGDGSVVGVGNRARGRFGPRRGFGREGFDRLGGGGGELVGEDARVADLRRVLGETEMGRAGIPGAMDAGDPRAGSGEINAVARIAAGGDEARETIGLGLKGTAAVIIDLDADAVAAGAQPWGKIVGIVFGVGGDETPGAVGDKGFVHPEPVAGVGKEMEDERLFERVAEGQVVFEADEQVAAWLVIGGPAVFGTGEGGRHDEAGKLVSGRVRRGWRGLGRWSRGRRAG